MLVIAAKHNTYSMSDEEADAFVKEIRLKGLSAVVDEKTSKEEEACDRGSLIVFYTFILYESDPFAPRVCVGAAEAMESLMAKQSTSLMQLNTNDELQVQGFIDGVLPGNKSG